MTVIGVTGGVGTGKSTVSKIFASLGAHVLDADRMSHRLMRPGAPTWRKIHRAFGNQVLGRQGRIDRFKLGNLVFQHRPLLRRLCNIVHPAVRGELKRRLARLRDLHPQGVAVLDVPLLIEAGSHYRMDALVVVKASERKVAGRLKKRSGWSVGDIRRRQKMQIPLSQKLKRADFVVDNGGSITSTRRQVMRIWKQVVEKGPAMRDSSR